MHPAGVLVADRVGQRHAALLGPLALDDVQVGPAHARRRRSARRRRAVRWPWARRWNRASSARGSCAAAPPSQSLASWQSSGTCQQATPHANMPPVIGDVLWTPPADVRETTEIGRYLNWLRDERGRDFADYDALWRWSVDDLEGFWGSVWDFFGVRAHAPYERVLGAREMPGAEWFPGARLNYAEHALGTDEDADRVAVVARSQTREPIELTFGELRDQVARARAGLRRLGVGPGDRVVAYLPEHPRDARRLPRHRQPRGDVGERARRSSAPRSVLARFGQIEPKVLLAVGGYTYRDRAGRPPRAGGRDPRRPADASSTSCTSPTARTSFRTPSRGSELLAEPGRARVRARRRSTTRSTCSSRRAPPGCRRRSCTATAASSSSTSRASAWAGTSSPAGACCGSRPPRG